MDDNDAYLMLTLFRPQFISDYNGEDRFMSRIGVGGLINLEKLKKAHTILNDIQLFQYHNSNISSQRDSFNMSAYSSTWWV